MDLPVIGHVDALPRALALLATLLTCFGVGPPPSWAQGAPPADVAAALVSTAWCQESVTGLSMQTIKLRFQPNGVLLLRKDTDLANGSHTGSNFSARGELDPGLLIIHEPNGGQSRLPMTFAGAGRNTRLTLDNMTYSVCR
jgi:hypothetical protein